MQQPIDQMCALGRAVIQTEMEAIGVLLNRVNECFAKACELLLQACNGRIIVMGMGKSGHIGRKVAATLASTGSPAFFVHPAEAKHGDLGMITAQDILLIFSNSGETEEILYIIPFLKQLNIPLITLTSGNQSTLAQLATVNIDISVPKEACPLGLTPTSSTTAALVMGDALAISLLQKRGFTAKDFAGSHPGGSLGRRLLFRVRDLMHTGVAIPKVDQNTLLISALEEMTQKMLGMTTVVNDNDKLLGIFTDGDIRRAVQKKIDIYHTPISEVMTKNPKVGRSDMLVTETLYIMEKNKITSLVVLDERDQLVGILHMHDILQKSIT